MRTLAAIVVAAVAAVLIVMVVTADEPLTIEDRVATLEALHGIDRSTPTAEVTATDASSATATDESEPTATDEPQADDRWHEPTDHEHGDAPPQWADDWSQAQFGHLVIYGGDESTPNENLHKHEAFKGYSFTVDADDGSMVDVYARIHMQTNPHGRAARFHSCEWYFRDATGAVSLMQWWCDFGDLRLSFGDEYPDAAFGVLFYDPGVRATNPLNVIVGYDDTANPSYAASLSGPEFWYAQTSPNGDWMPTFTVSVYDPSTYYTHGEESTAMDQATWKPTGNYGLDRDLRFRWIAGGSDARNIQGQPFLERNMDDPRGWFCADVYGAILSTGSSDCTDGLPQHIAPTLPTIGDETNWLRRHHDQWQCSGCVTPN